MSRVKLGLAAAALAASLLALGCAQDKRDSDASGATSESGAPQMIAPWQQIKSGMSHREVLQFLGEPRDAKVERISTFWFYSDHGMDGPYVQLNTSDMTVSRWRRP